MGRVIPPGAGFGDRPCKRALVVDADVRRCGNRLHCGTDRSANGISFWPLSIHRRVASVSRRCSDLSCRRVDGDVRLRKPDAGASRACGGVDGGPRNDYRACGFERTWLLAMAAGRRLLRRSAGDLWGLVRGRPDHYFIRSTAFRRHAAHRSQCWDGRQSFSSPPSRRRIIISFRLSSVSLWRLLDTGDSGPRAF